MGGRRGNLSADLRKTCPPGLCRCAGRPSSDAPDLTCSVSIARERRNYKPGWLPERLTSPALAKSHRDVCGFAHEVRTASHEVRTADVHEVRTADVEHQVQEAESLSLVLRALHAGDRPRNSGSGDVGLDISARWRGTRAVPRFRAGDDVVLGKPSSGKRATIGLPMGGPRLDDGEQQSRNWGLLLALVLCVEFWIVVSTYVAQNI